MTAIPLDRRRDVRMMQMLCVALGARTSGEAFERRVDMVYEARRGSEEIVAKFVVEVDELKRELAQTRAELELAGLAPVAGRTITRAGTHAPSVRLIASTRTPQT